MKHSVIGVSRCSVIGASEALQCDWLLEQVRRCSVIGASKALQCDWKQLLEQVRVPLQCDWKQLLE